MSSLAADRAVIVYRAVNVVNGHSYIGFTTQGLSRRVQNHRRVAGVGGGWKLHAAIRKYGVDSGGRKKTHGLSFARYEGE